MNKLALILVIAAGLTAGLIGCSESKTEKPIAEVREDAADMSAEQLQAKVEEYKQAIEAKEPEIEQLQQELGEGIGGLLSGDKPENAEELQARLNELQAEVKALQERLAIYAEELKQRQG